MGGVLQRWRARLWHWRWWLAAAVLLLAARALLPVVIRRVVVAHAAAALNARVDVGNVDLALWKGGVALENVAVSALHEPAALVGPGGGGRAIVAFRRLAVELRYWPLLRKIVQIREIELDGPRLALDRLASGDLNLLALVPERKVDVVAGGAPVAVEATPAAATGASAPRSPWKVGLDRFVLRDGRVRFRDLMLAGSEPVELGIDRIMVREIALSPGVYGEAARVRMVLGVDDGEVEIVARLRMLEQGVQVAADLNAARLPLRRARLYVPSVGWSDLTGELDLAVNYELEGGVKNELRGTLGLRDVGVSVVDLTDVALAWENLAVEIERIDLLGRTAAVTAVALGGAKLTVRTAGGGLVPVLAAADAGVQAASGTPAAPATAATAPWKWRVAGVRVSDAMVRVLSDQPPLDMGVDFSAADLAGAADAVAHISLALAPASGGNVRVDGDVRIAAPAFGGTMKVEDLVVPPLAAASARVREAVLPSAVLSADLTIDAGLPADSGAAPVAPDLVRVRGRAGLIDLRLAVPDQPDAKVEAKSCNIDIGELSVPGIIPVGEPAGPEAAVRLSAELTLEQPRIAVGGGPAALAASAKSIALAVTELQVPAALAGLGGAGDALPLRAAGKLTLAEPRLARGDGKEFAFAAHAVAVPLAELLVPDVRALAGSGAGASPARAAFDEISVDAPEVRITRTAEGIVLPAAGRSPAAGAAPEPSPAAEAVTEPSAVRPAAEVSVAAFRLRRGKLDFTDRSVRPAFRARLAPVEVDARRLSFPPLAMKPLRVELTSGERGRLTIAGDFGPSDGAMEVTLEDLALPPFNPYATAYSPYSVSGGSLHVKSNATYGGDRYDVQNAITLHQLDLAGPEGDSLFEQQFGIPLSLALALLRDPRGYIDLHVPVQVDESGGATVDVLTVVRSALRQALIGAVTAPLKLVGGVLGGGGGDVIAPAPIAFQLGTAAPSAAGTESIEKLASFLASRPGMAVGLEAAPTEDDVRWLHEQALARAWQEEGVLGRSLAFLTQRGPRQRIGAYLEARAVGEDAELDAEDVSTLQQWLAKQPPPSAQTLRDLAAARLDAVRAVLEEGGIGAARVSLSAPGGEPIAGAPAVKVALRPLG